MSVESRLFDGVEEVPAEVLQADAVPLTGKAPAFPWDQFTVGLAAVFDRPSLVLAHSALRWRSASELLEGLGDQNQLRAVVLPPLKGSAFWVFPEQEVTLLESLLLTKEEHPVQLQDDALTESFYRFFLLEVLYQLSQLSSAFPFTPVLQKQAALPKEPCLACDVTLACEKYHLTGRLLVTDQLRRSWVAHFAQHPPTADSLLLAKETAVSVAAILGKVSVPVHEWREFEVGDFLLFDQEAKKEHVWLEVNQHVLFKGQLEKGKIKITEKLQYQEGLCDMGEEEDFHDELTEDASVTEEEETEEMSLTEEELEDMSSFEETQEESTLAEEETTQDHEEISSHEKTEETTPSAPMQRESQPKEKTLTSLEDLPLRIHVEVGRFEISVEKFLQLEPGNMLPLDVSPEDGVYLTVHGKRVAKGELVRLGDLLGIRIVELATTCGREKPV